MSDANSRSETVTVSEKEEFGQGDIVRLEGNHQLPHMGVVINADCDLANKKTDGVISYLPMYSLREYLEEFWINDFLAMQKNQIVSSMLTTCGLETEEKECLLRWLHDDDNNEIVESLASTAELKQRSRTHLETLVSDYIAVFCSGENPTSQFKKLCSRQKNPSQFAQKQIQSAYKQMGDGHLVVNELSGETEMGFVVRMRRIYSLDEKLCFRSKREYLIESPQPDFAAIRVCKLSGVFQFKLAQIFAFQFSRVGLPDEFREMHSLVLDDLAQDLSKE